MILGGFRCGLTEHESFYAFPAFLGSCVKLERPTLAHFLADAKIDHDRSCACGRKVGNRMWFAQYVSNLGSTIGFNTSRLDPCNLDDPLELYAGALDAVGLVLHFMIETIPSDEPPVEKIEPFRHGHCTLIRIPGHDTCLPTEQDIDYAATCKLSGRLLVDKSGFVSLGHHQSERGWLPLLRRPPGFGKTMFLSMLESYVDAVWTDAPFPSEKQPLPSYLVHAEPARGSLLVLHLDLADLHVAGDTSEAVLRVACRDLLTAAATTCYRAYRHLLHDKGDDTCLDKVTLQRLLTLAAKKNNELFVGIDNYTAPLMRGAREVVEPAIVAELFQPIFDARAIGRVRRGFVVGSDIPGPAFGPYCDSDQFCAHTLDLSYDPVAFKILGLTEHEVVALGTALFGVDAPFLQQVRRNAQVPAQDSDAPSDGRRAYCTRDVLALARALRESSIHPSSVATTHIVFVTRNDYPPSLRCLASCYSDLLAYEPNPMDDEIQMDVEPWLLAELATIWGEPPVPAGAAQVHMSVASEPSSPPSSAGHSALRIPTAQLKELYL